MLVYMICDHLYLDRYMALWTPLIIAQNPRRPGFPCWQTLDYSINRGPSGQHPVPCNNHNFNL